MILRFAWLSVLLLAASGVLVSAFIGGVWLWGVAAAPSMAEARAIRDQLLDGERLASEVFAEDWQALCVAGPYADPQQVILDATELAQTPCQGWDEDWQGSETLASFLLVTGRSCRAVPVRRDIFDAAFYGGQCYKRSQRPVLSLVERGSPARRYLRID